MNNLYEIAGLTRQALHQHSLRQSHIQMQGEAILTLVNQVRSEHPKMGCRKMYYQMDPDHWGRDTFEQLLLNNGYRVKYAPNYVRTTYSQHLYHFPDLTKGLELTNINQLWATDITYYFVKGKFYYLTFIVDVYSRRIIGYNVDSTLKAEANIRALQLAFKTRKGSVFPGLIHHSDKGSQFIDKEYQKLISEAKMQMSMCNEAWENPFAERVNGIIKNEYLDNWLIETGEDLKKSTKRAVTNYNKYRPHWELLDKMTPVNFEKELLTLGTQKRPTVTLYTDGKDKVDGASSPNNLNPKTSLWLSLPDSDKGIKVDS
jgi:transposase InsO family protein